MLLGAVPSTVLDAGDVDNHVRTNPDHDIVTEDAVLPAALHKLAVDEQDRSGSSVGHHQLAHDRVAFALCHLERPRRSCDHPAGSPVPRPHGEIGHLANLGASADME